MIKYYESMASYYEIAKMKRSAAQTLCNFDEEFTVSYIVNLIYNVFHYNISQQLYSQSVDLQIKQDMVVLRYA